MSKSEQSIKERNKLVHAWLIRAGRSVTESQFAHVFSPDAPPIGWHLWHMARFADRLQAKLGEVTEGMVGAEVWESQGIFGVWVIDSSTLGVFDSGMGQSHEDAQKTIRKVGQGAILGYAQTSFEQCDHRITTLSTADFQMDYYGILDYAYDAATGRVWASEPTVSSVAQDLVFHAARDYSPH